MKTGIRHLGLSCAVAVVLAMADFMPAATAVGASTEPFLNRLEPDPAESGAYVAIGGRNLLPAGGGTVVSTIKYGRGPGAAVAELPTSLWSPTGVRVKLPTVPPGETVIWLALYRNNVEVSNRIELHIKSRPTLTTQGAATVAMATRGLEQARVANGPSCAGESVVRLQGGPFQPGTDSHAVGRYRWREGTTGVEVAMDGNAAANRFWNDLIYSVRVLNERELEVRLGRCFVVQSNPRIRVIRPNGFRSNWRALSH